MCGICGFVSSKQNRGSLEVMCAEIEHRGPDAVDYFIEDNVGLGHRRLSIIDLAEISNQPMLSNDGKLVIVFNGEIYNYAEIKKELVEHGCVFRTNSDTEVILEAFNLFGIEAVHRFIGMFAFAIYDRVSKSLYIFRDRVGVKPLLYYWQDSEFYFASELKALIPLIGGKQVNEEAMNDYFRFGYIRSPRSIFKNIQKLPPGHYLVLRVGHLEIHKYWDINDKIDKIQISEEEAEVQLEGLMQSAFGYRMVADVPVGVFLSGGVDSSSVTALLAKSHSNLKTFSIGFDDDWYNEATYAKQISSFFGTKHHEKILSSSDAEKVLNEYFQIYDEPFADSSGIPVFLISQFAKENGCKVVLSADGGDELFAGYDRYFRVGKLYTQLKKRASFLLAINPQLRFAGKMPIYGKNLQHKLNKFSDLVEKSSVNQISFYAAYLSICSESEIKNLLKSGLGFEEEKYPSVSFEEQMMLWDFKNYLPDDLLVKVDKASMATSIEAREPFLDHRLVEYVFNLPLSLRRKDDCTKYLLKKILFKHVPEKYFARRKMGFSIPLFKWFSQKLDKEFDALFSDEVLDSIAVLDKKVVIAEYKKYKVYKAQNKEYNILFIWHVYVFIKWWLRWM